MRGVTEQVVCRCGLCQLMSTLSDNPSTAAQARPIDVPHPQKKVNVVLVGNGVGPVRLVEHYTKAKCKTAQSRTNSFCPISTGLRGMHVTRVDRVVITA